MDVLVLYIFVKVAGITSLDPSVWLISGEQRLCWADAFLCRLPAESSQAAAWLDSELMSIADLFKSKTFKGG